MAHLATPTVFLPTPGFLDLASSEIARCYGYTPEKRASSLVTAEPLPNDPPPLAFTAQVLPHATFCRAASISQWGELFFNGVLEGVAEGTPWRGHIFPLPEATKENGVGHIGTGRAALIEQSLTAHLKKRRRSLLRSRISEHSLPFAHEETLVQLCLLDQERGIISVTPPAERHAFYRVLSRFPGGVVHVPRDPRPPSRAYLKLLEAESHFGRRIQVGETCVDLGASPGGWSFVAAERGAHVIAIDRAPLREDLMRKITFFQQDAFRYTPVKQVDWLLCDLIAFPEKSLQLLRRWLSEKLCRAYCVTLKFRGSEDYPLLEEAKTILHAYSREYFMRHLENNKNEVTVFGSL